MCAELVLSVVGYIPTGENAMNAQDLLKTHRLAHNEDVPRLVDVANQQPDLIIVRNLFYDDHYTLSEYAVGPFNCVKEGDFNVLVGLTKETRTPSKLRFVNSVVELFYADTRWEQPSLGGVRLYLPKD